MLAAQAEVDDVETGIEQRGLAEIELHRAHTPAAAVGDAAAAAVDTHRFGVVRVQPCRIVQTQRRVDARVNETAGDATAENRVCLRGQNRLRRIDQPEIGAVGSAIREADVAVGDQLQLTQRRRVELAVGADVDAATERVKYEGGRQNEGIRGHQRAA
jgi:hypothetical protein